MSLENKVLEKLAEATGTSGRHEVQIFDSDSGWTLYLTADRRDDLSCKIWELTLRHGRRGGGLEVWAQEIAERARSLPEAVRIYEVDGTTNQALLRTEPVRRQGNTLYYEIHLHDPAAATLRRFQAPKADSPRRQQVAFTLTTETLAALVAEITGA
jgi:hypothetical protein